ncbi:MAG: hypothetical protein HKN71_00575 [Gemmatimonadetes bacterium]|nr:hypothetical protein [Gemmatimonadota bacterium]
MSRRVRTFAGLLALVAMTASFSQALLASVCASPAAMATMPDMGMSMAGGDNDDSSGEHQMPCDWMSHADGSGEKGERCPLTPTATQGCTATASAPATALVVDLSTAQSARHVRLDSIEPELLLADPLYHPPRA